MPGREFEAICLILLAVQNSPLTPYRVWRKTGIPRMEKVLTYIRICEEIGYIKKVKEERYHKNGNQMRREYFITPSGRLFLESLQKNSS